MRLYTLILISIAIRILIVSSCLRVKYEKNTEFISVGDPEPDFLEEAGPVKPI